MDLHRSRRLAWLGVAVLVAGVVLLAAIADEWESDALIFDWKLLLTAPGAVLFGVMALYLGFRPFRCRIDEHGLTLRLPDEPMLARSVGWESIEAIMLEPRPDGPPRLVLVPVAGADIGVPAEYRNGVDGRPSVILVNVKDVREPPDQVRAALQRYAGDRYTHAG